MRSLWIVATVLASVAVIAEGQDGPPTIVQFPEDDMDAKGLITKSFRIPCKVIGKNVEFTWKQFDLNDQNREIRTYVKKSADEEKMLPTVVEADGTLHGKEDRLIADIMDGYYQCFAKNSKGTTFSRKLRLRITSVSDFNANSPVNLGEKDLGTIVSLTCPPLKRKSYGAVRSWGKSDPNTQRFNGLGPTINRIVRNSDGQLTFSPLTQDDCTFFKDNTFINCKAEAGTRVYSSSDIRLTCSSVSRDNKVKPEWVQKLESTTKATEGKEVNMFCAAKGSPTPVVRWFFNDNYEIKAGERGYELPVMAYNRFLIIKRANRKQHEGKYTCQVDNKVGSPLTSSTTLTVLVQPKLVSPKPPPTLNIPIYSSATVECKASGNPAPTYTWWQNGKQVQSSKRALATNNKLTFTRAELADSGVYQCVATNEVGMVVTETEVLIEAKPPTFSSFGPFPLFLNGLGKLPCKTTAAPDPTKFIWYHNGDKLMTNVSNSRYFLASDGTLLINGVRDDDKGDYECNAENIIGSKQSPKGTAKIYVQTVITVPPRNITVQVGKVFDLRCEAAYDERLELRYRWLKDGFEVKNILDTSGRIYWDESKNVLRVSNVGTDDAGKYTCIAFTPGPQESEAHATGIINIKGVPDPPSNLKVTDCQELTTTLSWLIGPSNDSPITHFLVEQESQFEPNIFTVIKNVTIDNATSTNLQLTPWADLRFRVRAVNRFGPSRGSDPTPKGKCQTKEDKPYKSPDNLRGVPGGPEELNITWTPLSKLEQNAPGCKYLLKYRKKGSGTWTPVEITDPATAVFKVPNAGYYVLWEFNIQAINSIGQANPSETEESYSGQDAPIFPPQDIRDIQPGPRFVELTWDPVKVDPKRGRGSIDGYRLYYQPEGEASGNARRRRRAIPKNSFTVEVKSETACDAGDYCKHKFEGFMPFQKYRFVLRAFNSGGPGPASEEVGFETKQDVPSVPTDVSVIPFGKYILLRWGPPAEKNGILKGYYVGVTKNTGNLLDPPKPALKSKLRIEEQEYLFEDLEYTTDYRVGVVAETGAGVGPAVYISTLTVRKMAPAKPALPLAKGITPESVNVTFEYGIGGGYPAMFMVKYKEKVNTETTPTSSPEYKESNWIMTRSQRWIEIKGLSPALYEFRTVGRNDEGSGEQSDPVDERPLAGILSGKRESSPFYSSGWFIVLLVIIVLLLLALVILVLVKRKHGAKYPVGKRENDRAGMLDTFPEDEVNGSDSIPHDLENPPPYPSQGSLDKPSLANESDRDSLDDYGEGPQFNEDGSFIGEYGDDRKNPPLDKDNPALATFV